MNDRHPCLLLQIRELSHGIRELPGFDTSDLHSFAVWLDLPTRLPIPVLLAGAEGATFLANATSPGCVMQPHACTLPEMVASNNWTLGGQLCPRQS